MTNQIIYVLTNQAMPGYVKIGKTTRGLEQRIAELSRSTSIPFPFECHFACIVENAHVAEQLLHHVFGGNRANPKREFFMIDPERAVSALKLWRIEEITISNDIVETQEDKIALNQARERLSKFNFEMVKIPIGAELTFSRDSTKKAVVIDNNHIEFEWVETSLSLSAQKLLKYARIPQWTLYWMYEWETLTERRKRFEESLA